LRRPGAIHAGKTRNFVNRESDLRNHVGEGTLDYELYLNTKTLLSCQTKFDELWQRG